MERNRRKFQKDLFIKQNKNKDLYLDGKSDLIRDFILQSNLDTKKAYTEKLKEITEQAKKEFYGSDNGSNGFTRLFDAYELKDGLATLKDGVNLSREEIELFKHLF